MFGEVVGADIEAGDAGAFNRKYWGSVCNDIDAIVIQTNFRGDELVQPLPRLLESANINASATIGRSLLELSVNFLLSANTIHATAQQMFRTILEEGIDLESTPFVSKEFVDEFLVRASFGSRYEPVLSNISDKRKREILTQQNILTKIDKLTKHPSATELRPNYNFLCELAHPNSAGYQRF